MNKVKYIQIIFEDSDFINVKLEDIILLETKPRGAYNHYIKLILKNNEILFEETEIKHTRFSEELCKKNIAGVNQVFDNGNVESFNAEWYENENHYDQVFSNIWQVNKITNQYIEITIGNPEYSE